MAEDRIICNKNKVYYSSIRKAMVEGARTKDEIVELAGVCNSCEGCETELEAILSSVCGCKEVSLEAVLEAIRNGADTVEKVGIVTKAGTEKDCGRCQALIQNVIDIGR
nr:(2Fe-2S)-binding protein [Tissierella sp.]